MGALFKLGKIFSLLKKTPKAWRWAKKNGSKLMEWINAGMAIEWIVEKVRSITGR